MSESPRDPRLAALVASLSPGEDTRMPVEDLLALWALLAPPLGSYAKLLAKSSIEVTTLRADLQRARAELATANQQREELINTQAADCADAVLEAVHDWTVKWRVERERADQLDRELAAMRQQRDEWCRRETCTAGQLAASREREARAGERADWLAAALTRLAAGQCYYYVAGQQQTCADNEGHSRARGWGDHYRCSSCVANDALRGEASVPAPAKPAAHVCTFCGCDCGSCESDHHPGPHGTACALRSAREGD